MSILFCEETQTFHLTTPNTSYIIGVIDKKHLSHIYWGKRIQGLNIENGMPLRGIGFSALADSRYSLDFIQSEFATGCSTDFRVPTLEVLFEDGSRACDLQYDSYNIRKGKQAIKGLPSTYVEDDSEADTLEITLVDRLKDLKVVLRYTAYNNIDVITRNVQIKNNSDKVVLLEKVLSASVDFEADEYEFIHLPGAWGRERHISRTPIRTGMQKIESRRGASSHQQNPFIAMATKNANEEYGQVYSMNFVYSGNFEAGLEVDQLGRPRMFMGINGYDFSWKLEPNNEFNSPEVVMVYSDQGLGEMSRTYHKLYRKRLVRGKYRDEPRPILANNWEATYFDFDEDKITKLAKTASELGIELLVLDDGWFGERNDDTSSLGDWVVNKKKLPSGIKTLAEKVNSYGVQFGLWFEPEMVSPNSNLYREHPDWCIHIDGRTRTECRSQLTLDLSRKEVCDYIIESVSKVLQEANISYVKWDMNRHMTELGSSGLACDQQKEMAHRYMLGLYYVLETITSNFPEVLFESCSGGGGRFDPGILYYMPQTWTSDDTDAVERLYIQYGTSLVYPISSMGSHVSAVPNHQVGRVTSLKMRGDVAMSGNFGYELDLTAFTNEEKEQVHKQIEQYKDLRTFIQSGDMYRLRSPFEGNVTAWQFVSENKNDIFAGYFRNQAVVNGPVERMKFKALDANCKYQDTETGEIWNGGELMYIGVIVNLFGDYQSKTWRLQKIEEEIA